MPDASAPLVIVTGATDGIGRETAEELTRRGARVIVHGRDPQKAKLVSQQIRATEAPLVADLSSFADVRAMAGAFLQRNQPLDVLLNNAGVYAKSRMLTADGLELTMAVNHYAPVLLTHLLMPALERAAQARIINVSSIAHTRGRVDLDDPQLSRRWDGYGAYAASKMANVLFTLELARRLAHTPITVNALHPGVVSTKLLKAGFAMEGPDSLGDGAATSVFLALDPSVATVSGRYFVRQRESGHSGDAALARAFYAQSCELVGCDPIP